MHRGGKDARRRSRRWRTDGLSVRVLLSLGIFGVLAVPGTYASWADSAQVSGTTVATGTVDLEVENTDLLSGWTAMNSSTLEPGDSTAAVLTVTNTGTAPLRYFVDATSSNVDGKGLGAVLAAKVTTDATTTGASPSVRCAGTPLSVSGTAFSANLVGTAAAPRVLAGGATEKLCVQARMPVGSVAQGATTDIGFTFNAFTGTAGEPGWTDVVPVSGTTLGTINAFYLGTNATGDTTSPPPTPPLPLTRPGPTLTTLFNYTTERHTNPGHLLRNSGSQSGRYQEWYLRTGTTPLTLTGTASLRIWTAMRGTGGTLAGALQVTLLDCAADGAADCSQLASTSHTSSWNSNGTWVESTIPVTTVVNTYTWQASRSLKIQVSASGSSGNMIIGYGATTHRSAFIIK